MHQKGFASLAPCVFAGLKADSSSAASQSAVVKALLAARASGDIPGVYGRLGDLGAIDAK